MPNRELREGLLSSEVMASLDHPEERLYIRLLACADDFGRFDARPIIVKARAFPMADLMVGVTLPGVAEWLLGLHRKGAIELYEAGGKPFLQVLRWKQRQRANESKYPNPTGVFPSSTFPATAGQCPAAVGQASGQCPADDGQMPDNRPASASEDRGSNNEDRGARVASAGAAASARPDSAEQGSGTKAGEACRLMKAAGIQAVNPSDAELLELLSAGVTPKQLGDLAAELIESKGAGIKGRYVIATMRGRLRDAAAAPAMPKVAGGAPAAAAMWQRDDRALEAMGRHLGMQARPGEDWATFRSRVAQRLHDQQATA